MATKSGPGYRRKPLPVPRSGKPGFMLVPATQTGISFSNAFPESLLARHHIYQDGSGLAAGDTDGDGRCDLYFCAINGRNTLYRNLGNWQFEDITEGAGVGCAGLHSTGAAFADLRGSANLDLIVNTAGNGTLIFFNDGHGHFRAIRRLALRNMSYASMGVDFADIDRDGRLDFITVDMLSREHSARIRQLSSKPSGIRRIGNFEEREEVPRNGLYWNRGDGTYAEIACFAGLAASDWSWAQIFVDVDLDGFEDLLVSTGSLYDVMDQDVAAVAAAKLSGSEAADARKMLSLYQRLDNRKAAFESYELAAGAVHLRYEVR